MCNIDYAFNSICTTDMNTTKDPEDNLISYSELATTNLTKDENNYYIKNKYTYLLDKTKFVEGLDPEKYNETLNRLYPELKKYMKDYVKFSLDNFTELYLISKGIENKTKLRNLIEEDENINHVTTEDIFEFEHYGGVKVAISLSDNILGSQNLMASSDSFINEKSFNLAKTLKNIDITALIKKLRTLSGTGNKLAYNLYIKIIDKLNNITDIIENKIPLLNNLINY